LAAGGRRAADGRGSEGHDHATGEEAWRPTARAHGGHRRLERMARALCCAVSRPLGHAARRPAANATMHCGRQQFSTQDMRADGRGGKSASKQVNLIPPSPIGSSCTTYSFFLSKLEKLTYEII